MYPAPEVQTAAVTVRERVIGERYVLLEELGRGGMAVVWRARDEVLARSVAVKLLDGRWAADPVSRARIRDEARAAAALSHPHIAQIYDYGETLTGRHRLPYVVMELVNGVTLQELASRGPLVPAELIRLGGQVASALAAAHAEGVVHRDIKPANVMVTQAGVKVVDFGIAAAAGPLAVEEELLGTPAYLAPERLIGDRVEPASDVYALAVMLYRLLSGESPWSVETTTQMLTAHVYVEPEPLPQLPGVPVAVTELVNTSLRKEPRERPSAEHVSRTLLNKATQEIPAPRTSVADPAPTRVLPVDAAARRRRIAVAGVAAGAVAVGALVLAVRARDEPGPAALPAISAAAPSRTVSSTATATKEAATKGATTNDATPKAAVPEPARTSKPTRTAGPKPTAGEPVVSTTNKTRTAAPATTQPTTPKTFTSAGGTVQARCVSAGRVEVVTWEPVKPYKVDEIAAGPATTAVVVFKHGGDRVRMAATCSGGVPSVTTT